MKMKNELVDGCLVNGRCNGTKEGENMPATQDLVGKEFGKLKVIKRLDEKEGGYFLWLCQCDCGTYIKVNTKRLTRGTVKSCGCVPKTTARNGSIPEDLTNRRFGKLVVIRRTENRNNRVCWLCRCDCGKEKKVTAHDLKAGKVKSCGCMHYCQGKRTRDISGKKFGRLEAQYPTERRDKKGSVYWHCKCDCGNELEVTEDGLVWGSYRSCGCLKEELKEKLPAQLHFVDHTCVEILEKRKFRRDNTSGFRGVYVTKGGKFKVCIGFKKKKYYLGSYETFEEAVEVRLEAEKLIHGGFLEQYYIWERQNREDPKWGEKNPLIFNVEKMNGEIVISCSVQG